MVLENKVNELSLFLAWCKENGYKPGRGDVLNEYMKRRDANLGYDFNLNKIKGLMAENKVTQKDLANMLNLSTTQTSKKMNGQVEFKVNELLAIADYLCVSPDVFFTPKVNRTLTDIIN
jgi:DNA-binding XRE family transcriptional regulator